MKIKFIIYSFLFALLLGSCNKEEIEIPKGTPQRTILAYMIAGGNLGSDIRANIYQMMKVASDKERNWGNLVIYYSENKSKSYLFQIKEDKNGKVITDTLRFYENQSAILPETMHSVIKETIELFPAKSYGLILSSHGTSWLPTNFSSLRSFGAEGGKNMEITELNEALEGFHFDFMLFDACYMSGIECAYELKDKTDYLLGSPTEVLARGFPYEDFLPALFKEKADLEQVTKSFYDYYSDNGWASFGTVSLIKTSELDELAQVVNDILKEKTEEDIYALPLTDMQILEYLTTNEPHMLYDFDDFIKYLASSEQYERFTTSMEKVVVSKYATPYSYYDALGKFNQSNGPRKIEHFSGLSVFVPQPSLIRLSEWYKRLAWYKAVY
ncbi:hypothetical protein DWX23_15495 [Parabacteroides sp. AF18-52]|jgi:hypothetical protein|uniref:clostripain-related cysteine peptidase n=1 Tax=Parabacteroides TaxID=375288 RepID=UPI000F004A3E|nr:clostripain-related cysteine peptidase [Parabacteroides sp. AF18-52]RHR37955.1 hypothetical protein DWX23_15495 [Parabacteroides sp. AF18-52]